MPAQAPRPPPKRPAAFAGDITANIKSATLSQGVSVDWSLLQVVDLEFRLLGWATQSPLDAFLQSRDQNLVPEPFPAFLGVMHRHNRPAARRGAGGMEYLAGRQALSAWMHGRD